jgi:hypothetical protein
MFDNTATVTTYKYTKCSYGLYSKVKIQRTIFTCSHVQEGEDSTEHGPSCKYLTAPMRDYLWIVNPNCAGRGQS